MDNEVTSISDESHKTAKQLQRLAYLKELHTKYIDALKIASNDEEFMEYCSVLKIKGKHLEWVVCSMLDYGSVSQTDICAVLGLEYNRRYHRAYADNPRSQEAVDFGLNRLDLTKTGKTSEKRSIMDILSDVIHGNNKVTDKVKAIDTLIKLQEKEAGHHTLKPWENLWINTILPKLISKPSNDKALE